MVLRKICAGKFLFSRQLLRKPQLFFRLQLTTKWMRKEESTAPVKRTFQTPGDNQAQSSGSKFLLLIIPVTTFGLGVWQIRRKKWKEDLISELHRRRYQEPVPLPDSVDTIRSMEYHPVHIKGKFCYDREIYLGPQSLIMEEGKGNISSGLISHSNIGYLVITPFQLSDRDMTILVNRGWVSMKDFDGKSVNTKNITGEVELTGIIRHTDSSKFGMRNKPETGVWTYRDIDKMANYAHTAPVFVDADVDSTVPGGPIGGQTRISLRNEHMSYIITWFGLSAFTGLYWYMKFMRGAPAVRLRHVQ